MGQTRLDKILCGTGCFTRSEARNIITSGGVTVDGAVVRKPEEKVSRESVLLVNGQAVDASEFVYYMLHKPAGYVSAAKDELYPAVTRLLPQALQNRGLFPVGRLDADVTGLLILTDDGAYAHRVTSPRSEIPKTYEIVADGDLLAEHIEKLASGVTLEDGTAFRPAVLVVESADPRHGFVTVTEGKYHEVKLLLHSCGRRILRMKRISIGALRLDETLGEGQSRQLTQAETQSCFGKL